MSDLIRKYDVVKICNEQIWNGADDYYPISANQIAKKVKEMPTIDAMPVRHGKWIDDGQNGSGVTSYSYHCSECGELLYLLSVEPYKPCKPYKFCPHCGARMDGTQKKPCDDCQQFDCYGCEYAWREE